MAQGRAVTGETIDKLLEGLGNGMTRRAACGHAGISRTTFYRMIDNDPDGTLVAAIENAEDMAEARHTNNVAMASNDPKNWTASAWWLERRRHMDYAKRDKVELSIDLKTVASRLADESGLDTDAILAEADRVVAGDR